MIYLYIVILVATSLVVFNPAISLILGILFAVLNKKNEIIIPKDLGSKLLKTGIILLGGTISYSSFASISIDYFPLISIYVFAVITIGILLGSFMKIEKKHLLLLVSGTAICGGTAMAALAPIIQSKKEDLASSITIIFLLNLVAIILFPIVGSALGLTQEQFGIFAALTIHDTASVIGTASIFGQPAMEVATILKLGRTLWIVPLLIFSSWYFNKKDGHSNFPYFILLFVLFILISSLVGFSDTTVYYLKNTSKAFLLLGLFFIGTEISFTKIKQIKYINVNNHSKVIGDRDTSSNLRYKTGRSLTYDSKDVLEAKDPKELHLPSINMSSSYIFAKSDLFFAYPNNYNHYVSYYRNTYQHGGVSLEEMVIPFAIFNPK